MRIDTINHFSHPWQLFTYCFISADFLSPSYILFFFLVTHLMFNFINQLIWRGGKYCFLGRTMPKNIFQFTVPKPWASPACVNPSCTVLSWKAAHKSYRAASGKGNTWIFNEVSDSCSLVSFSLCIKACKYG